MPKRRPIAFLIIAAMVVAIALHERWRGHPFCLTWIAVMADDPVEEKSGVFLGNQKLPLIALMKLSQATFRLCTCPAC
jgi:hypothetical protein